MSTLNVIIALLAGATGLCLYELTPLAVRRIWHRIDAWAAANIAAQVDAVLDESEREFIAAHPMEVEA